MACPYFRPTSPLSLSAWPGKLRPPLGAPYAGECCARDGEAHRPPREVLLEACNLGYAGGSCPRFPADAAAEAVRFSLRSDDGEVIELAYARERDHRPERCGGLRYDLRRKRWSGLGRDELLARQAEAYLHSYLRWKKGPEGRAQSRAAGR